MPFPKNIREESLVRSQRHCCVCHEFAGRAINVHHIQQESDDGANTLENSIVLCLRCHSEAGHFNSRHPIGTSYSPNELIRHRDDWWEACKNGSAQYSSSIQVQIKQIHDSSDLHTYKLLMSLANGNQHVISDWKLEIFIPSIIKVRAQEMDQHIDVDIGGVPYQKFQTLSCDKIFPDEERELVDRDRTLLEYDIDNKIYSMTRSNELNISWVFYTDIEPARKGEIVWEEMQKF